MFRNLFTVFLAMSVAAFGIEPPLAAQYGPPPQDQYSQAQSQYPPPQQYPSPQYGQPQQYPQTQQYPQYGQAAPDTSAQQGGDQQDVAQDQQHGVARISIIQGDVNVKRGDTGDLVAAVVNAPLMTQDHLQTSPGSRAEVELDSANLIRLAPNTDVGFADLEYHRYQVQLGAGTIIYRVLRDSNAQTEVDTPSIAVRPAGQGESRISVLDDGTTQITVRSGEVEIFSPRGSQRVQSGHSILVRGNPSDPEFQNTYEVARDQFDDWSATRDRELLASQSYQHVSRDIYGADDLDAYGNWVPSQYGQVWAPRPPDANWSPYSEGQWSWEDYYGWTWVDNAPWGWAPYHYGRWFWNGGYGWSWWPGGGFGSYLWSPALVGFFGWGGFGLGFGGLGWCALAPFEIFHGWWGHGWGRDGWRGGYGGYGRGNVAGMYRNAAFRGGAMTAAANSFGRPGQRFSPATRAQLTNASLYRGQVPVSPTRASYQFSNRQATANPRLASAANRQFFQHQQFRNQASLGSAQRGISPGMARGSMGNAPSVRSAPGLSGSRFGAAPQSSHGTPPNMQGAYAGRNGSAPRTSRGATGGWQRFGQPGTANSFRQGYTGGQEASGWHRFGQPQPSTQGLNGQARAQPQPNYAGRSFGNGNYQSRPLGMNPSAGQQRPSSSGYGNGFNGAYGGGRPAYSAPRYSAPAMPHYSAPSAPHYSAPHYSAPSAPRGGGGGGSFHGGGGSPHGGGGGGHSSSGGHHGR